MTSQLSGVFRQSTERPARLTIASAPSNSTTQGPNDSPSHLTCFQAPSVLGGDREMMQTSKPDASNACAKLTPKNPEPPVITIFASELLILFGTKLPLQPLV